MKIKSLLNLVLVLVAAQLMFACSSAKYYEFAAHKAAPYHELKTKPAHEKEVAPETLLSDVALAVVEEKEAAKAPEEPVLEASVAAPVAAATPKVTPVAPVPVEEVKVTEAEALAMAKERIASMTKAEKKEFRKEVREALKQDGGGGTSIIKIILAILLPPLAVFLHDGIGTSFWISIILWLLGVIPGIIYALLVVTDTI
ncbi:YqaE/Pmp3 family membrane protein [Pontibacter roseus]|nr:YqaE/Pmp3 family membrane protein [Pontibacter roseus]